MDTNTDRLNMPYAPTDTADLYPETDGKTDGQPATFT